MVFNFPIELSRVISKSRYIVRYVSFRGFTMNTDMESENWRGVPLTEIWGSQSPWGAPEFPLVAPAFNHTVLYHIPSSGCVAEDHPPKPQNGQDKWDHDFVRMPCSSQSLYPVEDNSGESHLKKRWAMIQDALWKPIRNSQELAATILSYNTQFTSTWKFKALHKLFNEHLEEEESQYFFDVTLPEIAKLALELPKLIPSPIPLLKQHKNRSISLSQQQISCLLANAFFCTFPRRNSNKKNSEYATFPHINFNNLYDASGSDAVLEKLKCICHYFRRVCTKAPAGTVTVSRRAVAARRQPGWPQAQAPLARVPLHLDPDGTIEDSHGLIQMDFANKFLGGGVLGHGCVQEEIRFVICPELLVSMLFTEALRPNEALMIIGCERYSKYSGYGTSFRWAGDYRDATPRDSSCRRRVGVLALDALPHAAPAHQYRPPAVLRELNKAWIGFTFFSEEAPTSTSYPGVATGNWGCGAFGGSPQLKSLLQLMACAEARRPMAYYTFQDLGLRDEIMNMYNLLTRHNVTVGQLYHIIVRFCQTDVCKMQLYTFIQQTLKTGPPGYINRSPRKQFRPDVASGSGSSSHQASKPEQMDISDTSEGNDVELPESIQKALLESPDLFAPDDTDQETQIINYTEGDVARVIRAKDVTIQIDDDKSGSNNDNKATTSLTAHLFDEMNKLDESNGRLNLSKTHNSILGDGSPNISVQDTSIESREKPEPSSEMKRKMAKKITDYFSKKTI